MSFAAACRSSGVSATVTSSSLNGTFVNAEQCDAEHLLEDGDTIALGDAQRGCGHPGRRLLPVLANRERAARHHVLRFSVIATLWLTESIASPTCTSFASVPTASAKLSGALGISSARRFIATVSAAKIVGRPAAAPLAMKFARASAKRVRGAW